MSYTITKADMATLLGRSLSDLETANYDTFLAAAKSQIETAINGRLDAADSETSRKYRVNRGFRQLFIDPFSKLTSAKIDGVVDSDSVAMNGDSFNGSWFNSVVFSERMCGRIVEVEADWGFGTDLPHELRLLWAQLFDAVALSGERDGNGRLVGDISREAILSHSIQYESSDGASEIDKIIASNSATVAKYRVPDNIRVDAPAYPRGLGDVI